MDPNVPQDTASLPDATGPPDPRRVAADTPPPPAKSGSSVWPLVLVGILAILWVVPGAGILFLVVWGVEGDSPSQGQKDEGSLIGQAWMLGLVGLIALWCGLVVMRYLQRPSA